MPLRPIRSRCWLCKTSIVAPSRMGTNGPRWVSHPLTPHCPMCRQPTAESILLRNLRIDSSILSRSYSFPAPHHKIFLAPWLIFQDFSSHPPPIPMAHPLRSYHSEELNGCALQSLRSDDGVSSAIRQKLWLVRSGLPWEWFAFCQL